MRYSLAFPRHTGYPQPTPWLYWKPILSLIVALDGRSYRTILRRAPHESIIGGRIYDAVIATCPMKAKVAVLLTFNEAHFLPFAAWGLEIVIPGRPKA